jgi:N-acetylgalactosamine-N,N'-diacetylbacillosaminyl-diphospho-undecaprenol 4-alpha-N-acetylgalactosaminyltransferase
LKKDVTLFINSLTSGGAERVVSVVITELIKQGFTVELFCIEKDNTYTLPKEVNMVYLSSLTKHDSALKKLLYLPYLALKLKKEIKRKKITLIQSHIYRANFINLLAKFFGSGQQVQVVEVTSINNLMNGGFAKKINFLLIKLLYRHADLVLFKAERMRIEFLKNILYKKNHIVINNPYNIEQIEAMAQIPCEDFTFSKKKEYLITVGRLNREKGIESLLESLLYLNESVELIVVGEGEERTNLEAKIKELNIESRVHLLGKKSNPFQYVARSSLFILPSHGEGFPNVLVEAMICKTAIISTDCISGPREILAPKSDISFQLKERIELAENGILYPVKDTKSLIEAIELLLKDRDLREKYIQKGRIKSKEYALKKIVKKYKEALCVA